MHSPSMTFWVIGIIINFVFFGFAAYWLLKIIRKPTPVVEAEETGKAP